MDMHKTAEAAKIEYQELVKTYNILFNNNSPYIQKLLNKHGRYDNEILHAAWEADDHIITQVIIIEDGVSGEIGEKLPFLKDDLPALQEAYQELENLVNMNALNSQYTAKHFTNVIANIIARTTATYEIIRAVFKKDITDILDA